MPDHCARTNFYIQSIETFFTTGPTPPLAPTLITARIETVISILLIEAVRRKKLAKSHVVVCDLQINFLSNNTSNKTRKCKLELSRQESSSLE